MPDLEMRAVRAAPAPADTALAKSTKARSDGRQLPPARM